MNSITGSPRTTRSLLWLLIALLLAATLVQLFVLNNATSQAYFWAKTRWGEQTAEQPSVLRRDYRATVQALPVAGVSNNLSGLTFDPDRDHLWAVVNNPTQLLALDRSGNVLQRVSLEGFNDTEAVAYLGDDMLVVVEERRQNLVVIAVPDRATDSIQRDGHPFLTLKLSAPDNNEYEGVSYDRENDRLFLVRERKPMRLYEIGGFRATLEGDLSLDIYEHRDLVRNKVFATDLSSVHYHQQTGNLLLLSDESRMIIEFSPQGNVVAYRTLRPGFAGLQNLIPQAEGLAMDDAGSVFVVSEPNLFYRFDPQ
ncbi:SdiA-regulated domain-containing protein [Pseudomonas sp.]|uniref:SdiA-regulated domain-containing protein n=1 Tax=Pseudomonas sp. TaxID=306 RepID=UPI00272AC593|nr:SdiA-regulated domain-containing protein [Pseudomonas sp.]